MQIEYITIDNKKYGISKEIKYENTIYVYLANLDDPKDQLIKKYTTTNPNELLPLETDAEFTFALNLYVE